MHIQQTKQQHIEFNSFGHRLTVHSCIKLHFHFFFRYLIRCYNNPSKTFNMDQQSLCTFKCGTYLHVAIIHTHIYAQLYMLVCLYCKHFVIEVSLPRGAQILCFFHYNCQKIYYSVFTCTNVLKHKRCFFDRDNGKKRKRRGELRAVLQEKENSFKLSIFVQ